MTSTRTTTSTRTLVLVLGLLAVGCLMFMSYSMWSAKRADDSRSFKQAFNECVAADLRSNSVTSPNCVQVAKDATR